MDELDIFQLLRLAQAGDHLAFERLHTLLAPPLLRFVRRLIGDNDAEDVVQETLMTLYLHLGQIEPPEKLRPYVYRVARNRCTDLLRKSGRYSPDGLDDEAAPIRVRVSFVGDAGQAPDDAAHWLLLHLQVREAIDQLPPLQQQALILYADEGLSYAEIAEVMGVGLGTVKSRLFNAKRSLRRLLPRETLAAIESEVGDSTAVSQE